ELGVVDDAGDFVLELLDFLLQRRLVLVGIGTVGGLHGQFADALQVVGDFLQGAFGSLRQRNAVVGIAGCLFHAADLGGHALRDGQAGGVVPGAVDAQAGGQTLDRGRQAGAV